MEKEQFIKRLNGNLNVGGTFNFFTARYEGFIFWMKGSRRLVIWVDDKGFTSPENSSDAEPRNIGEFQSIEEMLAKFKGWDVVCRVGSSDYGEIESDLRMKALCRIA